MTVELKKIKDIKDDPSLKEAQAFVGGWVEMVRVSSGILLIDEEGKMKNKEVNAYASDMYANKYGDNDVVVGDAIYIPNTLTKSQWFS
jgi:hypothetical protein